MQSRDPIRIALALAALLMAAPAPATEDAAQRKDLGAVIALSAQPCG
jgi:hypothetical protein